MVDNYVGLIRFSEAKVCLVGRSIFLVVICIACDDVDNVAFGQFEDI